MSTSYCLGLISKCSLQHSIEHVSSFVSFYFRGGSLSQHENVNEKETREDKSKEKENTPKEDEEKLKDHSQIHQTEGSDASDKAVNFL